MTHALSIVVPTWNRKDLLGECLTALEGQTLRDFEVIVVDDGSTDDTESFVRATHPNARIVRLECNRGFAVATNAGIRAATADLILLLNNDMTVAPDFVERLVAATASSDAALFAPLVLFRDEPELIYCAGDEQWANGRPSSIGFRCARESFHFPKAIFGVSAGAGLYRRTVFDTVGLLDERFVAYFEDSDLSFRARLAGFKTEFVADAVAWHIGSASIEGRTWWRTRQCYRNHALLVVKNMPLRLMARHAAEIAAERLHHLRRLWFAARAAFGAPRAVLVACGAWVSLMAALPHALVERRRIQRKRSLSARELDRLLRPGARYR